MSRYDLIGYCSYRDNETGFVADDFVNILNKQDEKIKELERENNILRQTLNNLKGEKASDTLVNAVNAVYEPLLQNKFDEIKQLKHELACELYDHEKFVLKANGELQKLKAENIELCTKLNMKEHEPAFCKLADRDCECLGKVEELKKQLKQKSNENDNKLKLIRDLQEKNNYLYTVNQFRDYNSKQLAIKELENLRDWEFIKKSSISDFVIIRNYIHKRINELRGEK